MLAMAMLLARLCPMIDDTVVYQLVDSLHSPRGMSTYARACSTPWTYARERQLCPEPGTNIVPKRPWNQLDWRRRCLRGVASGGAPPSREPMPLTCCPFVL